MCHHQTNFQTSVRAHNDNGLLATAIRFQKMLQCRGAGVGVSWGQQSWVCLNFALWPDMDSPFSPLHSSPNLRETSLSGAMTSDLGLPHLLNLVLCCSRVDRRDLPTSQNDHVHAIKTEGKWPAAWHYPNSGYSYTQEEGNSIHFEF